MRIETPTISRRKRLGAGLLAAWLIVSPTGLVFAGTGIVADGSVPGHTPTVSSVGSIPLVNIATPNAAGISHNRYQSFSIDANGAILNNSRTGGANALGVQIAANPNLTTQTASLIINEVVSGLPSQLNGPLAIFGDPAKLIIANPNGITCDGCGFINTSHVTLTTGTPQWLTAPAGSTTTFDTATAVALQVSGGQIVFTGQGLSSPLDRLDAIAQTLSINAPVNIGSGALNLIAGRQTIDHMTLAQLAVGAGNTQTDIGGDWAIDASAFGAMNAGQIKLISTATGMGVRSNVQLAASSSDLTISANGDLSLKNVGAANDVTLTSSGNITHTGISAGGDLNLSAAGDVVNAGTVAAGGNLSLTANHLDNTGQVLVAQGNASLTLNAGDANTFVNTGGQILAAGNLTLAMNNAALDITATQSGQIDSGALLSLSAKSLANSGSFTHAGDLNLSATDALTNNGTLTGGGNLTATVSGNTGQFANNGTLQALGALSLNLTGSGATGSSIGTIQSGGDITLAATSFTHAGNLTAGGNLSAAIGTLTNSGTIAAVTDATISLGNNGTDTSSNAGGTLQAGNNLTLTTAKTGNLGGSVIAGNDLTLNLTNYSNGSGETSFLAGRDIAVNATNFTNQDTLAATRNLTVTATGTLTNTGTLVAGQDTVVSAGTLANTNGLLEAAQDLHVTATDMTNTGILAAGQDIYLTASSLTNTAGTISATRDLQITADAITNGGTQQTTTYMASDLAGYVNNVLTYVSDPTVQAKLFNEQTPDWVNKNSRITLNNRNSIFRDSGDTAIRYIKLVITEYTDPGTLTAGRNLTANVSGTFSNNASLITAGQDIQITAAQFNNNAGQDSYSTYIQAGGAYENLGAYKNASATVQAAGNLTVTAPSVTNSGNMIGNSVWLGSSTLVNGLTNFNQPTPDTSLPSAITALTVPSAGSHFTPTAGTLYSSGVRLSLLVPGTLNSELSANLQNSQVPYLMDAWLEDQAIRQAALKETGLASFLSSNDPEAERAQLYSNAASFANANGIKLGVALTQDQIAQLTAPILWYVEQTVTGPDGKPYQALVPQIYLPDTSRSQLANTAGGMIQGNTVTLNATQSLTNTGYVVADTLNITTPTLVNEKRNAYWGSYTQNVKGGYIEVSIDKVQPGGFISATNLTINASHVTSVSGEFYQNGTDYSPQLAKLLGANYTQSTAIDHVHVTMHKDSGSGLTQVATMVVAIVASMYLGPIIGNAIGDAAGVTASSGTFWAAGTTATATSSGVSAGLGNIVASTALTSMATNAASQLILTGKIDSSQMFKSGLTAGLTAGVLNAQVFQTGTGMQSLNQIAGVTDIAGTGAKLATFNWDSLGTNLLGMAGRGLVTATIDSAINHTSFGTALNNSIVGDLAAVGANAVGSRFEPFSVTNILGNGIVGAVAAKLTGKDSVGAAIGAMTSAVVAPALIEAATSGDVVAEINGPSRDQQAVIASLSTLAGGLAAYAAGRDPVAGATAAQNEVINNALQTNSALAKLRRECGSSADGACALVKRMDNAQATINGMPSKGPWQIVAYVNADGVPVAYGAYNTVNERTDFVMDPQDLPNFMQSNTVALLAAAGYDQMKENAPKYAQLSGQAALNISLGIVTLDGATVKTGLQQYTSAWGEALSDQGWWLQMASSVTGGLVGASTKSALITSNGTANAATVPQLANQLTAQNLANIAAQDSRLAAAINRTGNFSIGNGTAAEADALGKIWVGDGAQPMEGVPGGLVSADGTMTYRPPTPKNSPFAYTGTQANFQQLSNGQVISNGHLNIIP